MLKPKWLAALLIGSLCTFVSAQSTTQPAPSGGAGGGQGRGEMLLQRFHDQLNDLNLTDDQSKKIDGIFDKAKSDFQTLAPQFRDMQPAQRQQKVRDLMTGMRDQINDVLTADQKQKLQQKIAELRQQRGNGRFGQPNGANSTNSPTTFPSNAQQQPGAKMDALIQRLQDSLATLNLNPDQKTKSDQIIHDTKSQLDDLRNKTRNGDITPDGMRSQVQDILSSTRDQLAEILTKDQQQQLHDEIEKRANEPATRPTAENDATMQGDAMKDQTMQGDAMKDTASASSGNSKNSSKSKSAFLASAGPKVGDPLPTVDLKNLTGRPIQLSNFKGRVVVIEFGSYSSPSFRDHAAKMETLAKQNDMRAAFLIVYTKEAHPTGGWDVDRNKEDRVSVSQATDIKSRTEAAEEARNALRITIPIALDSMDNATAAAFGAGENSAVVIGKDGKIAAKEEWCDPYRLKIELDQAINGNTVANAQ